MRPHLFVLCLSLSLTSVTADAIGDPLVVVETTLLGGGRGELGVWPGGGNVTLDLGHTPAVARLDLTNAGRAVLNFNNHTPLRDSQLAVRPPRKVRIRFRRLPGADDGGEVELSMRWRLKTGGVSTPASHHGALNGAGWTTWTFDPPPLTQGASASGYSLSLSPAGLYELASVELITFRAVLLTSPAARTFLHRATVDLVGRTASGVKSVTLTAQQRAGGKRLFRRSAPVGEQGRFSFTVSRDELAPGKRVVLTATVAPAPVAAGVAASHAVELFVFPALSGRHLPPVTSQGRRLIRAGKPFGFVGTNYTGFQLGLSNHADYEAIVRAVDTMADWGVSVVRVPINIGLIQVAPGVFPDDPQWEQIYRRHRLDPEFLRQFDYFVAYAGQRSIYTVIDWHGFPTNPFRYFLGGNPQAENTGQPGAAIAWLARDRSRREPFRLDDPRHLQALVTTHAWMARYLKGNPNILGFEVPHNEPHDSFCAVEANLARVTAACARAVKAEDPQRLTFFLSANYSHNNCTAVATWRLPDEVDGAAPHFYLSNGPVPLRPDAAKHKQPWMCRDIEATFSYSLPAALLPFSSVHHPVYDGEGGEHGAGYLLPHMDPPRAWERMLECSLTQYYAAGLSGFLNWTLWGLPDHFPVEIYGRQLRRFAPVYAAGPVDWSHAQVAFIQNPNATPVSNGHNFACVPFARLMLDLHLAPVHYLTDEQALQTGVLQTGRADYRALVVDRRKLDPSAEQMLARLQAPVLWVEDAGQLSAEELAAFLERAGIVVDRRTPPDVQVIIGPGHLLLYRRRGEGKTAVRVFPRLHRAGRLQLVDEDGRAVFHGSADELFHQGMQVTVPRWHAVIFRIAKA